jgi:hypothetical protein
MSLSPQMTPPLGRDVYSYTYSTELLICRLRVLADALIVYSIEERIIDALKALDGGHGISSRDALIGKRSV